MSSEKNKLDHKYIVPGARSKFFFKNTEYIPLSNSSFYGYVFETKELSNSSIISINPNQELNEYEDILKIYNKSLDLLKNSLNEFHNKNYSHRQWELCLGNWLSMFVWRVVLKSKELDQKTFEHSTNHILLKCYDEEKFIPSDTQEFRIFVQSSDWHEYLFRQICKLNKKYVITNDQNKDTNLFKLNKAKKGILKNFFIKLNLFYWRIFRGLMTSSVFGDVNVSKKLLFKTQIMSKVFPHIYFPWLSSFKSSKKPINKNFRNKAFISDSDLEYENIVFSLLLWNLPKVFLEDFEFTINLTRQYLPKKTKKILSSTSHFDNDFFKIWASRMISNGASFYIIQHGGFYGSGLWCFEEKLEYDICDYYINFGWGDDTDLKIIKNSSPFLFECLNQKRSTDITEKIKLITTVIPIHVDKQHSYLLSPDAYYEYWNDIKIFKDSLSVDSKSNLSLRPIHRDNGWGIENFMINHGFSEIYDNDEINKSFYESVRDVRMVICTSNTTTYLQCMIMNIPTLIFLNKNHWLNSPESNVFFEQLKVNNILFDDPLKLSSHVNSHIYSIEDWWSSEDVQEAKNNFIDNFALCKKNSLTNFINIIKND